MSVTRIVKLFVLLAGILAVPVSAEAGSPSMDNIGLSRFLHEKLSFDPDDYGAGWIVGDENDDSLVDYCIFFDKNGYKVFEANDYNKDGYLDDFYHYQNDVLVLQELDQNYDQKIDLWVYIDEGVYVEGYELDSDFDGRIDVVKLYATQ